MEQAHGVRHALLCLANRHVRVEPPLVLTQLLEPLCELRTSSTVESRGVTVVLVLSRITIDIDAALCCIQRGLHSPDAVLEQHSSHDRLPMKRWRAGIAQCTGEE